MVTVTQVEVETFLQRSFTADELPRLNMLIDMAEALVAAESTSATSDAVGEFVIFSAIARSLRTQNPEFKSETVGETSYVRFDNAPTGIFLTGEERASLRGVSSSCAFCSVVRCWFA